MDEKWAVPSAGMRRGVSSVKLRRCRNRKQIFLCRRMCRFAELCEAKMYGANVTWDGLISDCGRMVADEKKKEGWFDIFSTVKEHFVLKEQDMDTIGGTTGVVISAAVFYPTVGGVVLIVMWTAFAELEELGVVAQEMRPKDCGTVQRVSRRFTRAFEDQDKND